MGGDASQPVSPPPGPPDRWPVALAPLAFVVALTGAAVLGAVLYAVAAAAGLPTDGAVGAAAVLVQDVVFVATAVLLAATVARPRPADLGLRPVPLLRGAGAVVLAAVAFYASIGAYSALFDPSGSQDVLPTLGVDRGGALLVIGAVLVIAAAPLAEELLFRGFIYRCLRNRLSSLTATAVVAVTFGAVHFSGSETLELLPPLVLLGALFCVLYERTGSLLPSIALHALNNAIAFAVTADVDGAPLVAVPVLAAVLLACARVR
jgi:uncharacterized protein